MSLSRRTRSLFLLFLIVSVALALPSGAGLAAPKAKLGAMSGSVTAVGGTGLADVAVEVWLAPGGDPSEAYLATSTTTQRNGNWQIRNLELGTYFVRFIHASSETYAPTWYDGAPTRSLATPVQVQNTAVVRSIDAVLGAPGTISGRVLEPNLLTEDPNDYLPVAGIEVGAHVPGLAQLDLVGEFAVSNSDGYYSISNLPSGEYYLIGNDPSGYHTTAWGGDDPVLLTPDNPSGERDLWVSPAGAIGGRVTGIDGNGLGGLMVEAFTMETFEWGSELRYVAQDWTDADGYFFIGGVPQASPVKVRASQHDSLAAMYYGASGAVPVPDFAADVSVTNGQTTSAIDIQLLSAGGGISGCVTEMDGNTPIFNVPIVAYLWYVDGWYRVAGAWTIEDGSYLVTGLYPGDYHLSFCPEDGSGFIEESYHDKPVGPDSGDIITVNANETITIDESLETATPQE